MLEYASDWAPEVIAWVGAITALFAATIAVAQNDIKKVLAYSTVSQLGYMFLAVGTGAYVAAIFHMVVHAFFKALLFLGSGSVIHGMHDEQDMRRMGALRKFMPVTAATFIVGWLAIAGVPPLAGFWSKDEILLFALASNPALYVIGLGTALLTAYYMTRQVVMVFYGEAKWESHAAEHGAHGEFKPHESSPVMLFPLLALAGLSIVGGIIQLPTYSWIPDELGPFSSTGCTPSSSSVRPISRPRMRTRTGAFLAFVAVGVALIGIAAAIAVYAKHKAKAVEPQLLADGWKYDAGGERVMGGPGRKGFEAVAWFDENVVDGAVDGSGRVVRDAARQLREGQTGNMRNYAGIIGIGAVVLLGWFILVRGVL